LRKQAAFAHSSLGTRCAGLDFELSCVSARLNSNGLLGTCSMAWAELEGRTFSRNGFKPKLKLALKLSS
jgi:hypothetical protein